MTGSLNWKLACLLILAVAMLLGNCDGGPKRHLARIQAFRCSRPHQDICGDTMRGPPIPRDSLPPIDESFQVWSWHPGKGDVIYRVDWKSQLFPGGAVVPKQSGSEFKQAGDSSMESYNFSHAARARYVFRVMLMSPKGKVWDQDSLIWDYSHFPPADSTAAMKEMEHHHHE